MSLADYLAKNYLTADKSDKKSKKRKRREAQEASAGLVIEEDDLTGWNSKNADVDAEDGGSAFVAGRTAEFRRAQKSNWTQIGASAPTNSEQEAADAIIASAAAEKRAHNDDEDERPQVVSDDDGEGPRMESGARAGLQSGKQVSADLARRKDAERRQFEKEDAAAMGKGKETIYRDASGRIINVAMKRAEARRQQEEEEHKKAAELEAAKGDVQRLEKEQRKQRLQDAKYMGVARYADDAEVNDELKAQDRWNDPAAGFLEKKTVKKSVSGKPTYRGSAPTNRYGIRPGHRWDGVDRSNGFEKEYFAAQNRRQANKDLEYAWQMDD